MKLSEFILLEAKKKEKKILFVDENEHIAFPADTFNAIRKEINRLVRVQENQKNNSIELVDMAFDNLSIPKPGAHLNTRWKQYTELLSHAVKEMLDARGTGSFIT